MPIYPATAQPNGIEVVEVQSIYLPMLLASLAGLKTLPTGDMTVRQLILFLAVNIELGPQTVRGLATRFPMAKSDACRALDRLEAAGLIKRGPDPLDRRSVTIHGTSAGRSLAKKIENFAMKATDDKSSRPGAVEAAAG